LDSSLQERQIAQLRDRLRLISEVTRRFAEATTDYERLLSSVAHSLASAIGDSCLVLLLSVDGSELQLMASHATDLGLLERLRATFAGRSLELETQPRLREILARGDPVLEPTFGPGDPAQERARWQSVWGAHSAMAIPLRVTGRSIGVVLMGRFGANRVAFDESDRDLARNLTDHAGLAIENSRLYRAAQVAALQADHALQARDELERRLERTLDDMQEGYTIMSHDLRYVYVNAAGVRHTHLTKEQLLGRTPMELYPGFEGSKIHQALLRVLHGASEQIEEEFVHADGATGYFELTIQPVPEGLVVLSVDATYRRRAELRRDSLEEQLRQSQKMEAVGRLAGGVAHDFNNLLSVISGYGEDMLKELEPQHPLHDDLEEICKASSRAAELTKQLLMFSRQQVVEPKVMDLNEVVTGLSRMLERVLGESTELRLMLEPELGRIRADRGNLEQVCMNLAVNAHDAMPSGGTLTIETSNVDLDEQFVREHLGTAPGPYVVMAVSDTGIGMDRATRARIFEPFFTTKDPGKGTGLGLSTVFGIVQQSGGGIWVYSEPGRGTTFKLYLPRVDGEVEPQRPSVVPTELRGTETILLVEDEPQVRVVARRILERNGYQVLSPESVEEAERISNEYPRGVDLLVTDVVMPRLSGVELSTRLLKRRPQLKVLYVSGYTDGGIGAHGVLQDGAAFLQKPFTSDSLARKVRGVLDGTG
jgi:two-component system, cell cycle sensor histidine kinase and response regulator CckA